jgi:hypothetical protein
VIKEFLDVARETFAVGLLVHDVIVLACGGKYCPMFTHSYTQIIKIGWKINTPYTYI